MIAFILGILTLPAVWLLWVFLVDIHGLWLAVKKYGGENPRALNWFGKAIVRVFQFLQGKSPEEFRRNRLPPPHPTI